MDLGAVSRQVSQEFRNMAPGPNWYLHWRLTQARRPGVDPAFQYRIDVPMAVQPDWIASFVDHWSVAGSSESIALHLRSPLATRT